MKQLSLVPMALALLAGGEASAALLAMPAGSLQYIELKGNWADPGLCAGGGGASGGDAVNAVGALPTPSPNYVIPCRGVGTVLALADSTPNRLRSGHWSESVDSVFFTNAMVDTYTLAGPAGTEGQPVAVTVRCRVTGAISVGRNNSANVFAGGSNVSLEIGTWNPSSGQINEQFRVVPFFPFEVLLARIPNANYGATQPVQVVDYVQTATITRTAGQPFDIGYNLETGAFNSIAGWIVDGTPPAGDQMINATVDFDLPAGFTISSVRGWTDPDAAPPCAGDADGDGQVNFADITVVLTNFGSSGPVGDANHDGDVNFADITAVLTSWQADCD